MEKRIVVVEDSSIVALDIARCLKTLGYAVPAIFSSGEEAIGKLGELKADLVLMDIMLRDEMDGIEAAEQIRKLHNVPVVYLTAFSDQKTLERAKVTEPFGYITKPFDVKELYTTVEIALYKSKIERKLRESQEWLLTTLRSIGDAVIATDTESNVIFMNPVAEHLTGWRQEEATGKPLHGVFNIINEITGEAANNPVSKVLREGVVVGLANSTILIARDGRRIHIDDSAAPITDGKGSITGVVLVFHDITERIRIEKALRERDEKLRLVTDNMLDMITEVNVSGSYQYVSPSVKLTLGYEPADLLGRSAFEFIHPEDISKVLEEYKERLAQKLPGKAEFRYRHAEGHYLWLEAVGNPVFDEEGLVSGVVFSTRDITERKLMENQLRYYSLYDTLTGLYNRAYFEQEMLRIEKGRSVSTGLIICDIDGLKFVNDTLGHEVGDALLIAAAGVFKKSFRSGDMVARIGGDEFAVLLPNSSREEVEKAVRRIKNAVERHNAGNPDLPLSISVGFTVRNDDILKMSELFKAADNNMYREKLHRSKSTRSAIVNVIMRALKERDYITEGHADRLQNLVTSMALLLNMPDYKINDLRLLARFHDIGKVGIPDRILLKPGPLTSEEIDEMRRHSEIGSRIAQSAPELAHIADWILKHHEWWNGKGYPLGLSGEEIPVESRILAIADAYDAMTSFRPYREIISQEKALEEIKRCSGTQFDPALTELFLSIFKG